jgi:hypothetical protein
MGWRGLASSRPAVRYRAAAAQGSVPSIVFPLASACWSFVSDTAPIAPVPDEIECLPLTQNA